MIQSKADYEAIHKPRRNTIAWNYLIILSPKR